MPLIFPNDTVQALRILADYNIRKNAEISISNKYVFASTKNSERHLSGWHAINGFRVELNLENASTITATKNRHKMSTKYAMLDMSESEKESFYNHMGHSKTMNQNRNQCPPSLKEITSVGKFFDFVNNNMYIIQL